MKKLHHVGEIWDQEQSNVLAQYGFEVQPGQFGYVSLEPETFEHISAVLLKRQPVHAFGAVFDKADIESAEWLALTGLKTVGYPKPEDNWKPPVTYESSQRCEKCGVGRGRQVEPFRIKRPKVAPAVFQLEWTFDELFVCRDVYDALFGPIGIDSRPVLDHRKDVELMDIVQLSIPECSWRFEMDAERNEVCDKCGRKKFVVGPTDFLPPLSGTAPAEIFWGREFFGSGAQALKRIYLSKRIARELIKLNVAKHHQFYPLRPA